MTQNIYILSSPEHREIAEFLDEEVISNGIFESENLMLTESVLLDMAKDCMVEFFYVIIAQEKLQFPTFNFKYKPPLPDYTRVHVWNNDIRIRLFNKEEVLKDASKFTEESFRSCKLAFKNANEKITTFPTYDIIFLSFDEPTADENFNQLKLRWPRAMRVNGIKGIRDAHKEAAKLASTDMFFVVDADAEVVPGFNFDDQHILMHSSSVYVWHSRNSVNNLEYGYGGIKLFSKYRVLNYNGNDIDFTTSVSDGTIVIPIVANFTKFDTDPFSTWKSAFRECVKLSSKTINGQFDEETEYRLNTWCTMGKGKFGKYSTAGAIKGEEFGTTYSNQPEMLRLINNFDWLRQKFNS